MTVKTKISERDFITLHFVLLSNRMVVRLLFSLIMLIVASNTINVMSGTSRQSGLYLLTPILPLLIIMGMTFFSARKNYQANSALKEMVEYVFQEKYLLIKGESFNRQLEWEKIYKITFANNWIFIWSDKKRAHSLRRKDIWDGDYLKLREIAESHNIKNNL